MSFHEEDIVGRATLLFVFLFFLNFILDTMFSYKCIFILYCKDALNTGDCLTNNALKYDGPLLICRDSFSQDWLCLSMYLFLWNITVNM